MKKEFKNINKDENIKKNEKANTNKIKDKAKQNKQNLIIKNENGITLLALIVTIIVLLILAGITIGAITRDNGIIGKAKESKENAEIANEKEIVEKATVGAMGGNKYGELEEKELQKQLDRETGEGKTLASDTGENFEVLFNETNRCYIVDKDGNIGEMQEIVKDKNPGDITVGKDGEILDGSKEKPFEIWCIEDLVAFSNMVNGEGIKLKNGKPEQITEANDFKDKYVALKRNLNFESRLSYKNSERTDFGDINGINEDGNTLMNEMTTGKGFPPIGNEINSYKGKFEGNNYEIKNIFEETELSAGLFGYISSEGDIYISVEIKNITITGEIKSTKNVAGGLIGYLNLYRSNKIISRLINCKNKVNIISETKTAGGLVGYGAEINIYNSCNEGNIKAINGDAGGIIGICDRGGESLNIYNSYNIGTVEGKNAGGIIGARMNGRTDFMNLYNKGKISGTNWAGGCIGQWGSDGELRIYNFYNVGNSENALIGNIYKNNFGITELENIYALNNNSNKIIGRYGVGRINEEQKQYLNSKENSFYEDKYMKSKEFADELNENKNINSSISQNWSLWKYNTNNYPSLENNLEI